MNTKSNITKTLNIQLYRLIKQQYHKTAKKIKFKCKPTKKARKKSNGNNAPTTWVLWEVNQEEIQEKIMEAHLN